MSERAGGGQGRLALQGRRAQGRRALHRLESERRAQSGATGAGAADERRLREEAARDEQRATLLCCEVGPFRLLFEMRAVRRLIHLVLPGSTRRFHRRITSKGPPQVDLRVALGAPADTPGTGLLCEDEAGLSWVLVVDRSGEVLHPPLTRIRPLPDPLPALAALRGLRGVVELDDGGHAFLACPRQLRPSGALSEQAEGA